MATDIVDEPRRPLGEGPWGARAPGSRSRYREHVAIDLFFGRRPGNNPTPTTLVMPRPSFVEARRGARLLELVRPHAARIRVPARRVGSETEYRDELAAMAVVELLAIESTSDDDQRRAVGRGHWALRKLFRETSFVEVDVA